MATGRDTRGEERVSESERANERVRAYIVVIVIVHCRFGGHHTSQKKITQIMYDKNLPYVRVLPSLANNNRRFSIHTLFSTLFVRPFIFRSIFVFRVISCESVCVAFYFYVPFATSFPSRDYRERKRGETHISLENSAQSERPIFCSFWCRTHCIGWDMTWGPWSESKKSPIAYICAIQWKRQRRQQGQRHHRLPHHHHHHRRHRNHWHQIEKKAGKYCATKSVWWIKRKDGERIELRMFGTITNRQNEL